MKPQFSIAFGFRWVARIASLASLALLSAFIMGGIGEGDWPKFYEMIGLLCFPFGVIIGLIWAWRNELVGGLISIGSLVAFYIWHFFVSGDIDVGPYFLIFTAPAFLFLAAWWFRRTETVLPKGGVE